MRWRLVLLFTTATAAFCFLLLTASTDFSVGRHGHIASQLSGRAPLAATAVSRPQTELPEPRITFSSRPARPVIFMPKGSDIVAAAERSQQTQQLRRGQPERRALLQWDDDGWYREETALVTAYCPCARCCGSQSPGITSTGKSAWTPGLAADPIYLEYGTRVNIPGYGTSTIDDTGIAMRRHWRRDGLLHIDVRMTYHYEAQRWGQQYLRVKIYR